MGYGYPHITPTQAGKTYSEARDDGAGCSCPYVKPVAAQERNKSNGFCQAALAMGLLGFFLGGYDFSLLAIIFGIVGITQQGKRNAPKGKAVTGLVFGIVGLVTSCVQTILLLMLFGVIAYGELQALIPLFL
jgi:hypothetical protein